MSAVAEAFKLDNAEADGVSDAVSKWAAALSSVLAVLGTLGAAAVTVAGSAERMFREQLLLSVGAVVGLVLGFFVLALAVVLTPGNSNKSRSRRTRFIGVSIGIFGAALIAGTLAAGVSVATQEEPSVQAHLVVGDALTIEGQASATGLKANQRIAVRALGYPIGGGNAVSLYRALVGPARDGTLSIPFTIPVPADVYDQVVLTAWRNDEPRPVCDLAEANVQARVACALVSLPRASFGNARLSVTRNPSGSVVSGRVRAFINPGQLLWLGVFAEGSRKPLFEQVVAPDADGGINLRLPRTSVSTTKDVCVIAGWRPMKKCPPTRYRPGSTEDAIAPTWVVLPPP
jgi:hypothetical protein